MPGITQQTTLLKLNYECCIRGFLVAIGLQPICITKIEVNINKYNYINTGIREYSTYIITTLKNNDNDFKFIFNFISPKGSNIEK